MRSTRRAVGVAMLWWLCAVSTSEGAFPDRNDEGRLLPPAPMHEQVLMLPGDPARPVLLEVTVFQPDGPGPFPLAVVNHGASGQTSSRDMPRQRASFAADYFLSRGYAVALPMLRGYAGSGSIPVHYECDVLRAALDNARDIAAIIKQLTMRPNIDATRIIVAGQSYGGFNTLALGTLGLPGVKGLISFAGGLRVSDCKGQDENLISSATYLGGHEPVPSIWFYGDNDKIFPPTTWRAMYSRFWSAGGRADLVAFGNFMDDAHQMLGHLEGLPIWTPKVDSFLSRVGMPSSLIYPTYMPTPFPAATHYAAIDDDSKLPYPSDKVRAAYQKFLQLKFTRVFVVSPTGILSGSGGFDPIARTLELCRQRFADCQLYAVDNDVVWTGPAAEDTSAKQARSSHRDVVGGETTLLNFFYAVNPDCSLRGIPTIRLVQLPLHGRAVVAQRREFPRFPPGLPIARCDDVKVAGAALEYTPTSGYSGSDVLTFEAVNLDKSDLVFQIAITVR